METFVILITRPDGDTRFEELTIAKEELDTFVDEMEERHCKVSIFTVDEFNQLYEDIQKKIR